MGREGDIEDYRRARLQALLDSELYEGNKSALGRALGGVDGSYVTQLLNKARPFTEKTVKRIETACKISGWFDPPPVAGEPLVLTEEERIHVLAMRAVRTQNQILLAAQSNKMGLVKPGKAKKDAEKTGE